jgi:glyoxylase-like metal-dependent hydrolase (beta-lactamase superfamily II)
MDNRPALCRIPHREATEKRWRAGEGREGSMRITPIMGGRFTVDGGTMFGVVPKSIWARLIPPVTGNAIPQCTHCLVVELNDGRVGLVDTGTGDPAEFGEKERRFHGLNDDHWQLLTALSELGISPAGIDFVVLTHLHWDHAGGTGRRQGDGPGAQLTFPNAQHFVHAIEWDDAMGGHELLGKAYPRERLSALEASRNESVLLVTDSAPDILPGVRMARTGGHTEGHCAVVLSDEELELNHPGAEALGQVATVVFAGDVCPTAAHLRMVYQTSYDTHPLVTRAWKCEMLPEIAAEGYLVVFDHDPHRLGCTITPDPGKEYRIDRELPLPRPFDESPRRPYVHT